MHEHGRLSTDQTLFQQVEPAGAPFIQIVSQLAGNLADTFMFDGHP